ncbi:MAG: HlyD family efflux transporter periplasmic adaptor subunit [Gemmatimonadaceae bacterium]|nr:HlyD family efflux transporter periplasmic adaptor subunit [Gemmatimonadaceae bacterium]
MRCLALPLMVASFAAGCTRDREPDAYGTFEANEVLVSSEATGQLLTFTPLEGTRLTRGAVVAVVDTVQLALEREQIVAQSEAIGSRGTEVNRQIDVLEVQRAIAGRSYQRTRRLFAQKAATAEQLDQAERDFRVLAAQIEAAHAQRQSVSRDVTSGEARVAQIRERLLRSRVVNPETGTVLATFARAGEIVQPGQPLYRIANLDSLTLRAYIAETQLHAVRPGQLVTVHVDGGDGTLIAVPGTVTWISAKAEFTPTPVQTRDERAYLVYAIKVVVPNRGGLLKIGMPADLELPLTPERM